MTISLQASAASTPSSLSVDYPNYEPILVLLEEMTSLLHHIKTDPEIGLIQDEMARQRMYLDTGRPVDTRNYENMAEAFFQRYEARFIAIARGFQEQHIIHFEDYREPGRWTYEFFFPMPAMGLLFERDTDFPSRRFVRSALFWKNEVIKRLATQAQNYFKLQMGKDPGHEAFEREIRRQLEAAEQGQAIDGAGLTALAERFERDYSESLGLVRRLYSVASAHWASPFTFDDQPNLGILNPKASLIVLFAQASLHNSTVDHRRFADQGEMLMARIHANLEAAGKCEDPLRRF